MASQVQQFGSEYKPWVFLKKATLTTGRASETRRMRRRNQKKTTSCCMLLKWIGCGVKIFNGPKSFAFFALFDLQKQEIMEILNLDDEKYPCEAQANENSLYSQGAESKTDVPRNRLIDEPQGLK